MRGEHIVGGGKLTEATSTGGRRPANAQPAGGGGGGWADVNRKMAESAAKRQGGLAIQTQGWVQDKIAEGDIAGGLSSGQSGTSIFDPVLCELAYRWFSPPGGLVLDPFAGGSVRGIVAALCGREYIGVDLRPEQASANQWQAERICAGGLMPAWHVGDSIEVIPALDIEADFVFSCPPYGDLEVYSDNPLDLSTMDLPEFRAAYRAIIAAAVGKLKPDRFACFVVGDYRDRQGFYCGFVGETVAAFEAAGARLYNEAILVTAAGSLPIRAGKQFSSTRKLGKTHQQMLIFCKGDPRKATEACGPVELDEAMFDALEAEAEEPPEGEQWGEQL